MDFRIKNNMAKRKSKITIFAVLTTITIFIWVSFEAYQRLNKKDFQSIPENIIAPIAPSLDTDVLGNMEGRLWFADDSSSPPITKSGTEQKTTLKEASPSSEATRSAQ